MSVSLDGAGASTHTFLRGLPTFGERTEAALERLAAARRRHRSPTRLVVAAVIFQQNLAELGALVRKVRELGWDAVKFQPLEQTYLEPEDPAWYRRSPLWVSDPEAAAAAIDELVALKRQGWPVANSIAHLGFMKGYFAIPTRSTPRFAATTSSSGAGTVAPPSPISTSLRTGTFACAIGCSRWATSE